jgi:hypothetical protein
VRAHGGGDGDGVGWLIDVHEEEERVVFGFIDWRILVTLRQFDLHKEDLVYRTACLLQARRKKILISRDTRGLRS